MADRSTAIPIGICEDVPVVVVNVTILTDCYNRDARGRQHVDYPW